MCDGRKCCQGHEDKYFAKGAFLSDGRDEAGDLEAPASVLLLGREVHNGNEIGTISFHWVPVMGDEEMETD